MAITPTWTATPNLGVGSIGTANTNRDGTGTIVDLWTAGASGGRVERIVVKATVTTTAGLVRLFLKRSGTYTLWREVPVVAATPSATVAGFEYEIAIADGIFKAGDVIAAAPHNAETFKVYVFGGDF